MAINKPIFIVGSGRSGTTVFYNFLATHPEVCWFSNYSDRFVNVNIVPFLHRVTDSSIVGPTLKKGILSKNRLWIRPAEAERIYHDHSGFQYATKTTEDDLDIEIEKKFKGQIENHLALTGKQRFLNKQTANTQRIRLINEMFDDAYYIHIIRDGRAVANSLHKIDWWDETDIWWLGEKASDWEEKGKPPIELCGLHWKRDVEEILENKSLFENRYIEIRYEDFIADVRGIMNTVTAFCELGRSESFLELLPPDLPNMNRKWEKDLTSEQKEILGRTLNPFLKQLGYE